MKAIRFLKYNLLWVLYFGFSIFAVFDRKDANIFISDGPYSQGKYILWVLFFIFLTYSIYAGTKENFFKTLSMMTKKYWGWQIGIDLYIGLMFAICLIYFHGGPFVFLIWLLPILIYANLATLLYLALNYDSIIAWLIG